MPKVLQDDALGTLTEMAPNSNVWRGSIGVVSRQVTVTLMVAEPKSHLEVALSFLRDSVTFVSQNDRVLRTSIADEFLGQYHRDWKWHECAELWSPPADLTRERFLDDLSLVGICVEDSRSDRVDSNKSVDELVAIVCRDVPFARLDDPAVRRSVAEGIARGTMFSLLLKVSYRSRGLLFGDRTPVVVLNDERKILGVEYA